MSPFEYLKNLLVTEFSVPADRIKPEATLDSLGLDSLSVAELVLEVEDEYDIEFSAEQAEFETLGEVVAAIESMAQDSPSS